MPLERIQMTATRHKGDDSVSNLERPSILEFQLPSKTTFDKPDITSC